MVAKTLHFSLRMFWIFLNLMILKCDFQNKSILQIGSDSTRTVKPSPLLTWTSYLSSCSLGPFLLLRFCSVHWACVEFVENKKSSVIFTWTVPWLVSPFFQVDS